MNWRTLLAGLAAFAAGMTLCADVKLASPFTDNMVLQRDAKVPVWGKADPGEAVSVEFAGQAKEAKAGDDGKWSVALDPMKASSAPAEMKVKGKNQIVLGNVLVGDVWVCSGQSNMEWNVKNSANSAEEIQNANLPEIRLFNVVNDWSSVPLDACKGEWKVCSPDTVASFTAVGYFFARDLNAKLKVPIGLLQSDWGGTPAQAWTPLDILKADPDYAGYVEQYKNAENLSKEEIERKRKEAEENVRHKDSGNEGEAKGWAKPGADTADWKTVSMPQAWEELPEIGKIDGAVWFRKEVELPESWAASELTLDLGAIDDFDTTYFNGVKAGSTGKETKDYWKAQRVYKVPAGLAVAGKNLIAIRVFDEYGGGGLTGPAMKISKAGEPPVSLDGKWLCKVERALQPMKAPKIASPHSTGSYLYNAMIAPLIPYAIRGAIWYQGEANAGNAYQYRKLFPDMIKSWRKNWGQGDFPFYFVQLANFMAPQKEPSEGGWAFLREAQTMTLSLPNTGMAVIIDIGEEKNIHPKNKQDVGKRLALNARAKTYGESVEFSGPMYKGMKVEDGKARLSFDHVAGGLECKGDSLKGFAICGADKAFVWADARIDGDCVVVSAESVKEPVAVRYGWANNPPCNLYNKEGLPASPFRTDVDDAPPAAKSK